MASYIRCPECGFCIGKYAEFIDKARQAINEETIFSSKSQYANYDPEKMIFNSAITPSLEVVFDSVGINIQNRCCRTHLTGNTPFDKAYK